MTGAMAVRRLRHTPLAVVVTGGLILLLVARFILHSPFFQIHRESDTPER